MLTTVATGKIYRLTAGKHDRTEVSQNSHNKNLTYTCPSDPEFFFSPMCVGVHPQHMGDAAIAWSKFRTIGVKSYKPRSSIWFQLL